MQRFLFSLVTGFALLALGGTPLLAQRGQARGAGGLGVGVPPVTGTPSTVAVGGRGDAAASVHPGDTRTTPGARPAGIGHDLSVSDRLAANSALSTRLQPLLPPGTTLQMVSAGFRNEGQLIAALHVSRNLSIPFDQLQAKMTGSTHESLGAAIHDLRPNLTPAEIKEQSRVANRQAERDMSSAHVATRLSENTALSSRLQTLLPAGASVQTSAAGFRSVEEFAAAAHLSHNLNIPFADLKAKLTGDTALSLREAVQALRPALTEAQVKSGVKVAEREAKVDLTSARQES